MSSGAALCGWLPGIIFPVASYIQLRKAMRSSSAEGVSATTWLLYAMGNIGGFCYVGKFSEPQCYGYLVAAVLQVLIGFVTLGKRSAQVQKASATPVAR